MAAPRDQDSRKRFVQDLEAPMFVRALLTDVSWGWFWLPLRLYAGWQWLAAGWGKVGAASWTGSAAGAGLAGFVQGALQKASGAHPAVQQWYAWFLRSLVLPHAAAWSQMVAWGELLVGLGLIAGALTGLAAIFGGVMNLNYMLAGATSTNPQLLVAAVLLTLAWRTAGAWGVDRWLLPAMGTPWQQGFAVQRRGRTSSRGAADAERPRL